MRRKAVVTIGAILVGLSCAGVAFASHMLTGEVIAVSPSWNELTINVEGFPVTFTAKDRVAMALHAVNPGDMVTIETDSFTADFSTYNRESADWEATAYSVAKLRGSN
ncbi:hypothetical protein [Candidatus Methylomirabilis sp.]|uniref:Uncharacterized protein n=1 Tax=Candidatus Methylomirabilis tolerans TaxID=3123416 RepID=A0AAJ1AGU2_9BACT|nr:hypothetical protein [Candidatus Methylomirabilis sp.]